MQLLITVVVNEISKDFIDAIIYNLIVAGIFRKYDIVSMMLKQQHT